jgi:hypothetical protein
MSRALPQPPLDKRVTVLAIRGGEPLVTAAQVIIGKPHLLALSIASPDLLERFREAQVTILYCCGDDSLSLRGRVTGLVPPDRVLVATPNPPRLGERREFIRADLELPVRVEKAPASVGSDEALREWVDGLSRDPALFSFSPTTVDLSGSGARFAYRIFLRKGDLVAVSFLLPGGSAIPLFNLPARVVRARPSTTEEGTCELALEFKSCDEAACDNLNCLVFESRARQLGLSKDHVLD